MTDSSEAGPAAGVDDAQLLQRARAGDQEACAAICARYGDAVYDLCWWALRDHDEAADATLATFAAAAARIDQLRDPRILRVWLFALARREAMRRGRSGRGGPIAPATIGGAHEIVMAAVGELSRRDRVLLALDVRLDLEGQELADAIGAPPAAAYLRASRLRAKVERAVGSLLVARLGQDDCPELAALALRWDGRLDRLVRTRIARHVDACDACGIVRSSSPSPLALVAAAAVVPASDALRSRMLEQLAAPGPSRGRRGLARGDGFPPPLDRPPYRLPLVLGGAAAAVILLVGALAIGGGPDDVTLAGDPAGNSVEDVGAGARADDDEPDQRDGDGDRDGDDGDRDEALADADPPGVVTAPDNGSDADVGGKPALDTTGADTTSGPGRAPLSGTGDEDPAPPAPVVTTRHAPPATGAPANLTLGAAAIDLGRDIDSAVVTIRNDGDTAAAWTAGSGTTWISTSPGSGTIAPGETTDLALGVDRAGAPEGNDIGVGVTVWAGGELVGTISVSADVVRPPAITSLTALDARLVVQGCTAVGTVGTTPVTADVVDESGLARVNDVQPVVLEVTGPDGATSSVAMSSSDEVTWTTELGPFASPGTVSWAVVATDPHGNETRSAPWTTPVDACPPG